VTCPTCGGSLAGKPRARRFCSRRCAGLWQHRDKPRRIHRWDTRPDVGSEHRKLRKQLLPAAIGQPCPLGCGRIMDRTAQLDHIVPRAHGGATTRDNVRIICAPCNARRGQRLGGQQAHRYGRQRYAQPRTAEPPRPDLPIW
jgi:5-methylcytosine-specific restriction endonuclease McrA